MRRSNHPVGHPFGAEYDGLPLRMRRLKNGKEIWQIRANNRHGLRVEYFTDEAGDSTLFNAKGKVLIGSDGCSQYFILGTGWIYLPRREPGYRYHHNELYDSLVVRLFSGRLHKDGAYDLHFARRGSSDRTSALEKALQRSQLLFEQKWGIVGTAPITVTPSSPQDDACLQAVDYFLWALQRCFERNDDRYLSYVWPSIRLVHDLDDVRGQAYGEYYTAEKPLDLSALVGRCRRF